MSTLTILGREYDVRPLTPLELAKWNSHLMKLLAGSFWTDLYATIKSLPPRLQEVIFSRAERPEKLDKQLYFDLATRVKSVSLLLSMTVEAVAECPAFVVDESNAAEIFWALQPLILNKPVALSGGEGLAKLREQSSDAGLSE